MNKLLTIWDNVRSSLWFVPSLVVFGAVALAVGLIEADSLFSRERLTEAWPRVFGAGAEGSRGILSAIAGSMITVAGVTFSITIVSLALASSQYTSRILRNFMRDRANQWVLGIFVGIFAYCLVVLRTIRGSDEGTFVPALAIFVALILALVAIGFLIFFIHHTAASIQASQIIAETAAETLLSFDRLFPAGAGEAEADADPSEKGRPSAWGKQTPAQIPSRKTGYIQGIDMNALFKVAHQTGRVIRMERGVGDFVVEDCSLASVSGEPPDERAIVALNAACTVGPNRTLHQDAAYGIRQIVDIALKALSPGVNDTTTAINCIDYLGAILARLAVRPMKRAGRADAEHSGVLTRGATFPGLLSEAFDQIRQNADGNVAVLIRLLQIFDILAQRTSDAGRRQALREQADRVVETAQRSVPSAYDRAKILDIQARGFVSVYESGGNYLEHDGRL